MSAHDDALLMAAGRMRPDEYYDFEKERVCLLPGETARRQQGLTDARARKPELSSDPAYLRGYALGVQTL